MDTERYRTGFKRLWAAIVDSIVFMPLLLVEHFLLQPINNERILIAWQIFMTFAPIFYSIFLNYKYGQTIGKWVAGIKVLDVSETRNISLAQSFMREGVYLLVELLGLFYCIFLSIRDGELKYLLIDFSDFADTPFFIWTLLELITMLTNNKRRALHDLIAKSVVVRIE